METSSKGKAEKRGQKNQKPLVGKASDLMDLLGGLGQRGTFGESLRKIEEEIRSCGSGLGSFPGWKDILVVSRSVRSGIFILCDCSKPLIVLNAEAQKITIMQPK